MPFYLEMSKNITQQRDIYDKVIFRSYKSYTAIIRIADREQRDKINFLH